MKQTTDKEEATQQLLGVAEIISSSTDTLDSSESAASASAELGRILREHNVEYAQKVTRTLVCPVCEDPAKEPVSHRRCSQLFCSECLTQWIYRRTAIEKRAAECPHCRETLLPASCEPARNMERILDECSVYCPHCRAPVLRGNLVSHIKSACAVTSMKRQLESIKEQLAKEREDAQRALREADRQKRQFETDTERRYAEKHAALKAEVSNEIEELSRQKKEFRDALAASELKSAPAATPTTPATTLPLPSQISHSPISSSAGSGPVVHLNVSGTVISVSRQLLLAYPHSLLARQLTNDLPAIYDEHHQLQVNANPKLFRHIIAWLSTLGHGDRKTDSFGIVTEISHDNRQLLLLDAMHLKMYHLVLRLLPFRTQWTQNLYQGLDSSGITDTAEICYNPEASFFYAEQDAINSIVREYLNRIHLASMNRANNSGVVLTVPTAVRRFNNFNDVNWSERLLQKEDLSHCKMQRSNLRRANLQCAKLVKCDLLEANLESARMQSVDLQEANLQGANLRDSDLRGANLTNANLTGANLQGCKLQGANLRGANLTGANLSGVDLQSFNLTGLILREANLSHALLSKADLSQADLSKANLSHANLVHANLFDANLSEVDLSNAQLEGVRLSTRRQVADLIAAGNRKLHRINLSGIDLSSATETPIDLSDVETPMDLSDVDLSGADMRRCVLRAVNLKRSCLREANLHEADLSESNLEAANIQRANLEAVNLQGANLSQLTAYDGIRLSQKQHLMQFIYFGHKQLTDVNLRAVDLSGCDFNGCNLSGGDLSGCDLSDCDLSNAKLQSADLTNAKLTQANLQSTDLSKATLTGAVLHNCTLEYTILESATIRDVQFNKCTTTEIEASGADTGIGGLCFQKTNCTVADH